VAVLLSFISKKEKEKKISSYKHQPDRS